MDVGIDFYRNLLRLFETPTGSFQDRKDEKSSHELAGVSHNPTAEKR
jgi:hypothetical protein